MTDPAANDRKRPSTLATWARFTRFRLSPSALSNFAVGMLIANGGSLGALIEPVALGSLVMVWLIYLFGMGLNDLADRERDRSIHPDRPLPSGAISVGTAKAALWVLLLSAWAIAATIGVHASVTLGALTVAILVYDLKGKVHPVLGPVTMGAIRGMLFVGGSWVTRQSFDLSVSSAVAAGLTMAYVAMVTWFSQAEGETTSTPRRRAEAIVAIMTIALAAWIPIGNQLAAIDRVLWAIAGAIGMVSYLSVYATAPARSTPPRTFATTWRLLLGLFWLDAFYCLAFLEPVGAILPFALLTTTWRR